MLSTKDYSVFKHVFALIELNGIVLWMEVRAFLIGKCIHKDMRTSFIDSFK